MSPVLYSGDDVHVFQGAGCKKTV